MTAAHRSKLPLAGEERKIESWGIEASIHDRLDKGDMVVLLIKLLQRELKEGMDNFRDRRMDFWMKIGGDGL